MSGDLLKELTIPLFTGAIGYLTNWADAVRQGLCELCLPAQVREPDAGEDGNSSG